MSDTSSEDAENARGIVFVCAMPVGLIGLVVVMLGAIMIALSVKGEPTDYAALGVVITAAIFFIVSVVYCGYYTAVSCLAH